MMISSTDHHDLSVVCQVEAYQIVGQQKRLAFLACGGGGCRRTHRTPPPNGPALLIRNPTCHHISARQVKYDHMVRFPEKISVP